MVSKYSVLVFACISAAAISFGLIAPYEIVNSINLDVDQPNQSNLISKHDFDEDEFTGDSVPVLDNGGLIDQYP